MSFTNTTANYGLPQWTDDPNDKPSWLVDMNGAFTKIDAGMQANKQAGQTNATNLDATNQTIQTMQTEIDSLQSENTTNTGDIADLDARVRVNTAHIADIDQKADTMGLVFQTFGNNIITKTTGSAATRTYFDFTPLSNAIKSRNIPGGKAYVWLYINFNLTQVPLSTMKQEDIVWMNCVNMPFQFESIVTRNYGGNVEGQFSNVTLEIFGLYDANATPSTDCYLGMCYKNTDGSLAQNYNNIQISTYNSLARGFVVAPVSTVSTIINDESALTDFDRGTYTPPVEQEDPSKPSINVQMHSLFEYTYGLTSSNYYSANMDLSKLSDVNGALNSDNVYGAGKAKGCLISVDMKDYDFSKLNINGKTVEQLKEAGCEVFYPKDYNTDTTSTILILPYGQGLMMDYAMSQTISTPVTVIFKIVDTDKQEG